MQETKRRLFAYTPFRFVRFALLVLSVLLFTQAKARALSADDLLFYCAFNNSLEPTIHRGEKGLKTKGNFKFKPGVAGGAVMVGRKGTYISYATKGNLNPMGGAISLWVKPLDWKSRDGKHHIFFSLRGNPRWLLYKYGVGDTWFYARTPDKKEIRVGPDAFDCARDFLFKPGEWAHLVACWQDGRMALYINGRSFGETAFHLPDAAKADKSFSIGAPTWSDIAAHDTLIDEFMIFTRPLTTDEILALFNSKSKGGVPAGTPKPPALSVATCHFPSSNLLRLLVRPIALFGKIKADALYEISLEGSKLLANAPASPWKEVVLEAPVKDLPAGKHNLSLRLQSNKRTVALNEIEFVKPSPPPWLDNKLGFPKKVPPPWTPLEASTDGVKCWGRRYVFGKTLFPSQIVTQDTPLLGAPCRLSINGKPLTGYVQKRLLRSSEIEADYAFSLKSKKLNADVSVRVEFDGFMWFKVRIHGPADIRSLDFEIPMKSEASALIHADRKRTGELSRFAPVDVTRPYFWLGSETGGLQWFTDGTCRISVDAKIPYAQIIPDKRHTLVRIPMISIPIKLGENESIDAAFGLMGSPVKPYYKGWRKLRIGWIGHDSAANVSAHVPHWATLHMNTEAKDSARALVERYVNQKKLLPAFYTSLSMTTPHQDAYQAYAWEWRFEPGPLPKLGRPRKDRQFVRNCQGAKTWRDYYIWRMNKVMDATGARGFYYDVSTMKKCSNAYHGCGVTNPDGLRLPTINILGNREMAKRMYVMGKEKRPDMLFLYHMSGWVLLPYLSFSDVLCDGEQYTSYLKRGNLDYTKFLKPDTFRAEFMGSNMGLPVAFFPEFWRGPGKKAYADEAKAAFEHVLGLVALHDSLIWPSWAPAKPALDFWKAQDTFGWSDDVKFIPYWKQRVARANSPEVLVSIYRSRNRRKAMLIVFNESAKPGDVTIHLDIKRLGLRKQGELKAFDAFRNNKSIPLKNGALTLKLPPWNFAMVIIHPGTCDVPSE